MLDIKLIRTNPDFVKAAVRKREMDLDSVVDEILAIDSRRREMTGKVEAMKAQQNAATKKIPAMKTVSYTHLPGGRRIENTENKRARFPKRGASLRGQGDALCAWNWKKGGKGRGDPPSSWVDNSVAR